jgi:hypothetical protein
VAVTDLTAWGGCEFLRHGEGHRFPLDAEGRFTIRARVLEDSKYFRFSSFIVW